MPKSFLTDACLTHFEIGSTHGICTKSSGYFFPVHCHPELFHYFFLMPTPHLPCCIFNSLFSLPPVRLYPISLPQSFIYFTAVTVSTVRFLFPTVSFNLSSRFTDTFKTHLLTFWAAGPAKITCTKLKLEC